MGGFLHYVSFVCGELAKMQTVKAPHLSAAIDFMHLRKSQIKKNLRRKGDRKRAEVRKQNLASGTDFCGLGTSSGLRLPAGMSQHQEHA